MFNKVRAKALKLAAVASTLALSAGVVLAQAGDPVTAAMTDTQTKAIGYATSLVTLAAATIAFMVGIKYIKKIRGAA
jgi:hypothetical protein